MRRPVKASLYTHVITVPNDGIRRTGKARIRLRISVEAWKAYLESRGAK